MQKILHLLLLSRRILNYPVTPSNWFETFFVGPGEKQRNRRELRWESEKLVSRPLLIDTAVVQVKTAKAMELPMGRMDQKMEPEEVFSQQQQSVSVCVCVWCESRRAGYLGKYFRMTPSFRILVGDGGKIENTRKDIF